MHKRVNKGDMVKRPFSGMSENHIMKSLTAATILAVFMTSFILAGCGGMTTTDTAKTAAPVTLNVAAATSLASALKEVNSGYAQARPYVTITPNFAASGTLQQQIQNGAPVDVFVSAAAKQMDNIEEDGLIFTGTRRNLLNNNVVLIVPDDSTLTLTDFKGLTGDKVKKIAIGEPKAVPAGDYAQQAFDLLGITAQLQSKLVFAADVRQVLTYVETGNVDAGVVYSTDALTSTKVKMIGMAPAEINARVVYPVAVIKASKVADAATDYVNYLFSQEAKAIFEKYGFATAAK